MLVQYGSILNKQKMKQSSKILSLEKIPNCNKFDVSIIILKIIQNAKYTNDRTISLKLCSGTGFLNASRSALSCHKSIICFTWS